MTCTNIIEALQSSVMRSMTSTASVCIDWMHDQTIKRAYVRRTAEPCFVRDLLTYLFIMRLLPITTH